MTLVAPSARRRGRPPKTAERDVAQRIIDAAAACLQTQHELSITRIAETAQASEAMIRYYFGSKEGVYAALLDDTILRFNRAVEDLIQSQPLSLEIAVRSMVDRLAPIFSSRSGTIFLLLRERTRNGSPVAEAYRRRQLAAKVRSLTDVIESFAERGIYQSSLEPHHAALAIISLMVIHTVQPVNLETLGFAGRELEADGWHDHVTNTLVHLFSATASDRARSEPRIPTA